MSVKFEKETVKTVDKVKDLVKDDLHKVGEKLTGGKGEKGYLAVCFDVRRCCYFIISDSLTPTSLYI